MKKIFLEDFNNQIGGNEDTLEMLMQKSIKKTFNKSQRIYPDDINYIGLFIIMNGKIRFFSTSINSKEITIFYINKNESCLISTCSIINNIDSTIALEFMENSTILMIPDKYFKLLCNTNENFLQFKLSLISKRLKQSLDTISDVTFKSLKERIAKFLIDNAKNGVVNVSQEYIANNIGSARESVARALRELSNQNYIQKKRTSIILEQKIYDL